MKNILQADLLKIKEHTESIFKEELEVSTEIFITGATGFFGKWLLESLLFLDKELNLELKIHALSRNPEEFLLQNNTFKNEDSIHWIKGDVTTFEYDSREIAYIIHAATDSDSKLNTENPLCMLDTIIGGTKRVLEFARKQSKLKALLFTSSGAVYGNQSHDIVRIKETDSFNVDLQNPSSAYAEGKRLAELYCSIYFKHFEVPVRIARCFAFVGPYLPLNKHYAIGNFINDGLKGRDITVSGDGLPMRSYMYSADLVICLFTLLLKGINGEPYNIGSDLSISIYDLANKIASYFPSSSVKILSLNNYGDRNHNYVPDVSKFRNIFKFDQLTDLDFAIQKTIFFYKNIDNE